MAIAKITGAQRDFSSGELDESIKRADERPELKSGARQLSNFRILSTGAAQNRPGRMALFKGERWRVEEILMSPGNIFYLAFGHGYLRVYNAAGAQVFNSTVKGDGSTAIPWTGSSATKILFALQSGAANKTIFICYGDDFPVNVPQVLSWDGVSQTSTWTLVNYALTITTGNQKRTAFYRIAPPNIRLYPSNNASPGGVNITITFSAPVLTAGMIGTYLTYCGRQMKITGVTSPTVGLAQVAELLPNSQNLGFSSDTGGLGGAFNIGDVVIGAVSGATGIVLGSDPLDPGVGPPISTGCNVQLIPNASNQIIGFDNNGETVVGPGGSATLTAGTITDMLPAPVSIWAQEVMNNYQGWPTSCFFDQNRLGFCNFGVIPSAISWSAIGLPNDTYAADLGGSVTAVNAIFELAPDKCQVLYVVGGMEGSEFVFCNNSIYYIPISTASPLEPGSVAFNRLSAQGCYAGVQPRLIQQSVLFVKEGGAQMGAVQVPGAYYRPYIVDNVSEFHSHLFTASAPVCIAAPQALGQFEEAYAYVLLANGSIVMARYAIRMGLIDVGPEGKPKMGWLPWTGVGTVKWISAQAADVIFTTAYPIIGDPWSSGWSSGFGSGSGSFGMVEALDNTQYLDCAIFVNNPPTALAPGPGQGPLWWLPNGSVYLIDLGLRLMGIYQVDGSGNIIPQFQDGENLSSAQLVAGQQWTGTLEPFAPDAPPGQSQHQRMFKRRVSRMAVYVSNSTGFVMARLFSGPLTPTSPALGTVMNTRRVTAYNTGDIMTNSAPLREEAQRWRPIGRAFDPRVAVIKDTPGSLIVHEVGIECSI